MARVLAVASAVLLILGSAVAILQLSFGYDHLLGLARLVNLNGEQNLPTWFSSALLLAAAGSAFLTMAVAPIEDRWNWGLLGCVFVILSIDESSAIHELSNAPLRAVLDAGPGLFFPWVLLGLALAIVVGLLELRLLARLPRPTACGLISAGACYLAGSIGFEILAAPVYALGGQQTYRHAALVTAEEGLEMIGVALLIVVVLRYAAALPPATVAFDAAASVEGAFSPVVVIAPSRATRVVMYVALILTAISFFSQLWVYTGGRGLSPSWIRLVNLTREGNIPTWWQASTLLACGALCALIALATREGGLGSSRGWTVAAIVFVYLSMDEGAGIHELAVRPLRNTFHTSGLLYYPWIVIGAAVSLAAAVVSRPFLASLPRRTRRTLALAAGVFLLGALGVEAIGGMLAEEGGRTTMRYATVTTIEELLEMAGVVLVAKALLEHLRDHVGPIAIGGHAGPGRDAAAIPR